jgi:hypothetical protein
MKTDRDKIRNFMGKVDWITAENVCVLIDGRLSDQRVDYWNKRLWDMATQVKNKHKRIRHIKNNIYNGAFTIDRYTLPTYRFSHDEKLRNVLAKWKNKDIKFTNDKKADALVGNTYIEIDSGSMDDEQLSEKLERYVGDGEYQVLFVMASRHKNEEGRLRKIFKLSEKMLPNMPNRVLACCYTRFLKDGNVHNRNGKRTILAT